MAFTANKKFWTEFINLYESLPCLWNSKHEHYGNREKRNVAWDTLVVKLRNVEPEANYDAVKRKINTFRSNFNREVRKIKQSRNNGIEKYNPTLWYFDHLAFLLDHEKLSNHGNNLHFNDETVLSFKPALPHNNSDESESFSCCPSPASLNTLTYGRNISNRSKRTKRRYQTIRNSQRLADNCNENSLQLRNPEDSNKTKNEKSLVLGGEVMAAINDAGVANVMEYATSEYKENLSVSSHLYRLKNSDNKQTDHITTNNKLIENKEVQPKDEICYPNVESTQMDYEENITAKRHSETANMTSKLYKLPRLQRTITNSENSESLQFMNAEDQGNDEAETYGRAWAFGYRKLSADQKLYAKKAIDEILVLGQLNSLSLHTVCISPSHYTNMD